MKTILSFTALLIFVNCLNAQTALLEFPEVIEAITYVCDSTESDIILEKQTLKSADYFGKSNSGEKIKITRYEVDGCCSSIVIEQKSNLKFIVKVASNVIDPEMFIEILKLNKDNNKRFIEFKSTNKSNEFQFGEIELIKFIGKKNETDSYIIEIPHIESGEYAMKISGRIDSFNMFQIK
jgi:hypothetical protein